MEEKKLLFKEIDLTSSERTYSKSVREVRVWRVVHTDEGGYVEDNYLFAKHDDNSVTISDMDGDGFVSLDQDFVKRLVEFLK